MLTTEPLDLRMHDDYAGVSCTVANIFHMLLGGRMDPPDVDILIDRVPGEVPSRAQALHTLVDSNLSLDIVYAFDSEEFLRRGIDYLRENLEDEWTPVFEEYFSDEAVLSWLSIEAERLILLAQRPGVRWEYRCPELKDVRSNLYLQRLVWVGFESEDTTMCADALLYSYTTNTRHRYSYELYVPRRGGSGLDVFPQRKLSREWLRSEGLVAISR